MFAFVKNSTLSTDALCTLITSTLRPLDHLVYVQPEPSPVRDGHLTFYIRMSAPEDVVIGQLLRNGISCQLAKSD